MVKKYDLGKSSDMRKFSRDLDRDIKEQAKKSMLSQKHEIECPHCQEEVSVPTGKSLCPSCGEEINLTLNFDF